MAMRQLRYRFETEVHLGLLAIILLLLMLSMISNFVLYRARTVMQESLFAEFNSIALSVSREVRQSLPVGPTDSSIRELQQRYRLSALTVVTSSPPGDSPADRQHWYASIIASLPPGQLPKIGRRLLSAEYSTVTRGENSEYFYVYPIPVKHGKHLLILARNVPDLAFLQNSSRIILYISVASVVAIAVIYLLLSRFIFLPFRRIRQRAQEAGRPVESNNDDVDALVEHYEGIVGELTSKEKELTRLNKSISARAHSLEQYNDYLMQSMSSGVLTVDRDGRVLSINPSCGAVLQIAYEPGSQMDYREVLRDRPEVCDLVAAALTQKESQDYREVEILLPAGEQLALGISVSVVRDADGSLIGVSALMNDLTELKQLRRDIEIQRRQAALGEMAGGLAHQLRNSMGAIVGYGRLIRKRLAEHSLEVKAVAALENESRETEQLIERFLSFVRPFHADTVPTDIGELLDEVVDSFRVRSDCAHVSFVLDQNGTATILVDRLLMKQVFTNLIENAVNAYHGDDGDVRIMVNSVNSEVVITIEDRGCGIQPEDRVNIFTPFFSTRPSGTGLGLPLAGRIVEAHRGRISVISEPGQGTSFKIHLPEETSVSLQTASILADD